MKASLARKIVRDRRRLQKPPAIRGVSCGENDGLHWRRRRIRRTCQAARPRRPLVGFPDRRLADTTRADQGGHSCARRLFDGDALVRVLAHGASEAAGRVFGPARRPAGQVSSQPSPASREPSSFDVPSSAARLASPAPRWAACAGLPREGRPFPNSEKKHRTDPYRPRSGPPSRSP